MNTFEHEALCSTQVSLVIEFFQSWLKSLKSFVVPVFLLISLSFVCLMTKPTVLIKSLSLSDILFSIQYRYLNHRISTASPVYRQANGYCLALILVECAESVKRLFPTFL